MYIIEEDIVHLEHKNKKKGIHFDTIIHYIKYLTVHLG